MARQPGRSAVHVARGGQGAAPFRAERSEPRSGALDGTGMAELPGHAAYRGGTPGCGPPAGDRGGYGSGVQLALQPSAQGAAST